MQSVLKRKIFFTVVNHNAGQTNPTEINRKHLTLLIQYISGCLETGYRQTSIISTWIQELYCHSNCKSSVTYTDGLGMPHFWGLDFNTPLLKKHGMQNLDLIAMGTKLMFNFHSHLHISDKSVVWRYAFSFFATKLRILFIYLNWK